MPEESKPRKPSAAQPRPEGWRLLAQQASTEQDPKRLVDLVEQLCNAIDQRNAQPENPFLVYRGHAAVEHLFSSVIGATTAEFGTMQLLDTAEGTLKIAAAHGCESEFLAHFEKVDANDGCACGVAMKRGTRVFVPNVADNALFTPPSKHVLLRAGVLSIQSTPILDSTGSLIGVVTTHARKANAFDPAMGNNVDSLVAGFLRRIS